MLVFQGLSFQVSKKSFNNSTHKKIKFVANNKVYVHPQIGKVKNPTLLEWTEPLGIPLLINQQYQFEVFDEHQFGYNPEQMAVGSGKFTIDQNDRFATWEVISDRGNKIGFLSSKLKRKLHFSPANVNAPPQQQIITISSLIAHLRDLKQKRGYIVISLAGKQYKTQITKSKAGQLLFTQCIEIEKEQWLSQAKIVVFSYDAKEDKSQNIATGMLKLDAEHPEKRVILRNQQGVNAGDIFVDYKITLKQAYKASKELTEIVQKQRSKMMTSRVDPSSYLQASRTLNLSRKLGEYAVKLPLSKKDRVSVVNHNNKIFIPTQKRFSNYQDKQNNNVSYLQSRNGLDFQNQHAKRYYKGASIGKGDKMDFTALQRSTPGVGVYHLPSIWDRY